MAKTRLDPENLDTLGSRLARGEIGLEEYDAILARLGGQGGPTRGRATTASGPLGPRGLVTENPDEGEIFGSAAGRTATRLESLDDLQPGIRLFDQWRLVRSLGRGGFAAVFEAKDLLMDVNVAVKVLRPSLVFRDEELAKFRHEAALTRRLRNLAVVRVFDYREDREHRLAVLSMELVGGGDLRRLVDLARERGERLPAPLGLKILEDVLGVLAETHAAGGVHADVKPENVLLAATDLEELLERPTKDPQVRMIDFGVGGNVATEYAAPELVRTSLREATPGADVYSAAAVAYKFLTGELPSGSRPRLSQVREDLPHGFSRFLLKMLETDPGKRLDASAALLKSREMARRSREDWEWREKW